MRNNDVWIRPTDKQDDSTVLLVEASGGEVFLTVFDIEEGFDYRTLTNGRCIGVPTEQLLNALTGCGAVEAFDAVIPKDDSLA